MTRTISFTAIGGVPEVVAGTRLTDLVVDVLSEPGAIIDGDVVIVSSKIVAKAEGRLVELPEDPVAADLAFVALVEQHSARILRRRGGLSIVETPHGFVCANAGIDRSNTRANTALLLPEDPDRSARRIYDAITARLGVRIGVVITDTFGRAWRNGVTDVAIGVAGLAPLLDLRGTLDANGRQLEATVICVADEIAGAADLVLGKSTNSPIAIARGLDVVAEPTAELTAKAIVRNPREDLFR
jgi:coenzyme F420-0:L-glutamate ligase/coenzyme F420-1:gamma-L-glutamate ligase